MQKKEQTLGSSDSDLIPTLKNLASLYSLWGGGTKNGEAIAMLQRAIHICEENIEQQRQLNQSETPENNNNNNNNTSNSNDISNREKLRTSSGVNGLLTSSNSNSSEFAEYELSELLDSLATLYLEQARYP